MADKDLKKVGKKKPDLSLEKVGRRRAAVAVDEDLEREDTLEIQAFRKVLLKGGEFRGARGLRGEVGDTGNTGRRGRRGLRGDTGETGERGDTGDSIKGEPGAPGEHGRHGEPGEPGESRQGETGAQGPKGDTGPRPAHKWEGTKLSFEKPNGQFGRAVNLQGPGGGRGASGNSARDRYQNIDLVGTDLVFSNDAAGPLGGVDKVVDLSGLSGGGGGFAGLGIWRYRTDLTPNPAAGRLQFDTALIDNATELYVNEVNDGGTDMTVFLDLIVPGDLVYLQIQDDATQFVIIQVGVKTKAAGVYTFTISAIEGQGTTPTNNSTVSFVVVGGPLIKNKDITIQLPIPTDNLRYFFTDRQITISKLVYVVQGIVTSDATAFISFGPDRSVLATDLINAGTVVSDQTTGQVITVFDNAVIPANSHIALRVTAITDAPDELAATVFYA